MVKVSSFGSEYELNSKTATSKATVKLTDGLKATVAHRSASNAIALTLAGKQWEVQHDFHKKDTHLKYKAKLGKSTLTVKQHVPGGKWALAPNPVFELSRGGLLGKHSKAVGSYDFLNRVGKLEQTVYAGEDKEHKAYVKLSTAAGPTAGLRSKLSAGPLLHSAATSFSQKGGVHLLAKSKFEDGTKLKTSYGVKSEVLTVAAKHTPKNLSEDAAKASLTLSMDIPVRRQQDPKIKFGIKWDL
ncbi:hypothetical protein CHLNCDRAFT_59805 [Chlorella variabilis]|uniref:Uncharacterized protein n=1 Tax=Chlorella variabilis TaxID=554065 RepID=E1ZRG0_CHLVA|nr:hypothetical protein CHLNCDRAFT_59805 [Chlorella variabilis]EFN51562.1 hypothetical protein CHLNCDRAFT_59805 [Chlorella variabilis]|eukprot:XP_005843664.1 hypothetical protein CHLNCDRAFT_59805 [Chlorella variabilis]